MEAVRPGVAFEADSKFEELGKLVISKAATPRE
ncbi:hypothetical protein SAMN05444123_11914 [Rhodopseudomonas pseudopalustris]|uniref:Uncharacterized protein n=1 Tax=Rhodopseudomonas pseudopalustris TaxID=1513892 RepID=A0A1H8XBR8_9BRAD|nr:hypothetical protein SAMN05444123_11914 [Rhodopseudomonas pseudopalustris]